MILEGEIFLILVLYFELGVILWVYSNGETIMTSAQFVANAGKCSVGSDVKVVQTSLAGLRRKYFVIVVKTPSGRIFEAGLESPYINLICDLNDRNEELDKEYFAEKTMLSNMQFVIKKLEAGIKLDRKDWVEVL